MVRYHDFRYQAASWDKARRVVAKVEWPQDELFPRGGFIVTNLGNGAARVVWFYNLRGTTANPREVKPFRGQLRSQLLCGDVAMIRSAHVPAPAHIDPAIQWGLVLGDSPYNQAEGGAGVL